MKKGIKLTLIAFAGVIGTLVLLALVYSGVYLFRITAANKAMAPVDTGELRPGIFAVRQDFVNSWLVKGPEGYVAIDTGLSAAGLNAVLAKLGITRDEIKAVFLTHSDFDHAGGLAALAGIPLYIGADEETMVNGQTARAMGFIHNSALPEHKLLANEDTVMMAGLPVTPVFTPGHTKGHTMWWVGQSWLFSGDAFAISQGKIAPFDDIYNMDSAQALQSHQQLRPLVDVREVFTAHHGYASSMATLMNK